MKQLLTLLFIGLTSLSAQTIPSYVPTSGLVAWWGYNGNLIDLSGFANHGASSTVSLTTDRFNNLNSAYSFNGVTSQVNVGAVQNGNFASNSTFTYSFWIRPNGVNYGRILSYMSSVPGDLTFQHQISYEPNGSISFNCARNTGQANAPYAQATVASVTANQWHHVLASYNNGLLELWVDGAFFFSANYTGPISSTGISSVLNFGFHPLEPTERFGGKLDDIGIWNRTLTTTEALSLIYGCSDSVQSQPQNFTAYTIPGWANFKCKSTDTAATYQWQQNIGSGWSNLSNFGNYTGATSDSLVITGVTPSMNNYGYRSIVTSCTTDTSDVAVLTVTNGIGLGESKLDKLTISPIPTNGFVSLNAVVLGTYELVSLGGRILESGTAKKDYDLTKYPKGVYHLRLSTDEGTRVLKVVKN